jgi:hypothetical protein
MSHVSQTPQQHFGLVLQTVVGQAFRAAGYSLDDRPAQQRAGLFRYTRPLEDGHDAIIEFQVLTYTDTEHSSGMPSRFRVTLMTTERRKPASSEAPARAKRRDLSALVVTDFGVPILPSAEYWWSYRDVSELGRALAEAGHLIVGYGMPWLEGKLTPP